MLHEESISDLADGTFPLGNEPARPFVQEILLGTKGTCCALTLLKFLPSAWVLGSRCVLWQKVL